MRRATLLAFAAGAVAPAPAVADTVAHRTPVVGPKIAGLETVWGEERDEGVRLMIGVPRAEPRAFTPRRRRVGDLDLSADRAVWAVQETRGADYDAKPSGPARIASRPL